MALYLTVAIAIAFNIFVIIYKATHDRKLNALIDFTLLAAVIAVFSGSEALLIIGTISSALISIGLFFAIPKSTTPTLSPEDAAKWLDKHLT